MGCPRCGGPAVGVYLHKSGCPINALTPSERTAVEQAVEKLIEAVEALSEDDRQDWTNRRRAAMACAKATALLAGGTESEEAERE